MAGCLNQHYLGFLHVMVSCCITVGDLWCAEFKALRLGSTQPWQQELVSHKRAYG